MAISVQKASREWWTGPHLLNLEQTINSTVVSSTGWSPAGVMHGREPRTALSAQADWTTAGDEPSRLGVKGPTREEVNVLIAQHHEIMGAVQ